MSAETLSPCPLRAQGEAVTLRAARAAPQRLILAALLGASLVLSGCNRGQANPDPPAAAAPAKPNDPLEVVVPPEMASNFSVTPVGTAQVASVQEVSGRIAANERLVARIGAAVSGRVTEVLAEVGDPVSPGQVLAHVASPELTTAQLNYRRAYAGASLAQRGVERARQLLQADVIGSAELQRRQSELSIARAERRAAEDQLHLMGVPNKVIAQLRDKGELFPYVPIVATRAGSVIARTISAGQVAQPGDPMFIVADLSSVWLVGAIPEHMATGVRAGQKVTIIVPALGDRELSGELVHVGDVVSPETRTVAIRTQLDNEQRDLKPQMLAIVRIQGEPREVLAVPARAVVRENDRDHVFVREAENRYRLTAVELGENSGGVRPVLQGVRAGTPVVTEGAFHLNNERKRAELG